jgi:HEAT repeat protein
VTGATALALGLLDDRASVPLLLEAARRAKYPPDLVRPMAEGLSLLAEHPVPEEMVRLLGLVSGRTAQAALADALGRIGDVRTIAPLIALLQDVERTDRARSCAASALGTIADKMDVPWNARLSRGIDCWDPPSLLSSPGSWSGLLDRLH